MMQSLQALFQRFKGILALFQLIFSYISLKKLIFYSICVLTLGYTIGFLIYQHLFYMVFTRHYNQRKVASHVWIYRRILGESGRRHSEQYQIKLYWMLKQPTELWHLKTPDGMELHGHFIRNPKSTHNAVAVLAHGFRGNPLQLAHFVHFYQTEMGYHVLLPIARGHSSSAGDLITFGHRERNDYLYWIEEAIKELGPETQVVLHGVSMGGATVLLTGAKKNLPPQVKAIISDSSFSSLDQALAHQFPTAFARIGAWMLSATDARLKEEAEFGFQDANVLRQVGDIPVPILFIHGTQDRIIPVNMVNSLYEACPHPKKHKLHIKGAGHAFGWFASPYLYSRTLKNFLEESLDLSEETKEIAFLPSSVQDIKSS